MIEQLTNARTISMDEFVTILESLQLQEKIQTSASTITKGIHPVLGSLYLVEMPIGDHLVLPIAS